MGLHFDYQASGPVRRIMRLLVTTRPVAWLSARYLPDIDRLAFRVTGGRVTPSAFITGLPVVQVATIGARTGRSRTVRLLGIPDGSAYLLIAANFGQKTNPAWYYNIRVHPRVTMTVGATSREYVVHELEGDERAVGFDRALLLNPGGLVFVSRQDFARFQFYDSNPLPGRAESLSVSGDVAV